MPARDRHADREAAAIRALCRDDSTIPERIALLEEHATAVKGEIEELLRQQTRLDEKLAWYRGQLSA